MTPSSTIKAVLGLALCTGIWGAPLRRSAVCCRALTAECMACADGVTVEAYCAANPEMAGCPNVWEGRLPLAFERAEAAGDGGRDRVFPSPTTEYPVPRVMCWNDRLDGAQIIEGLDDCKNNGNCDCYTEHDQAVAACEKSATCLGIATQSNVCNGKYRLAHGDVLWTWTPTPTLNHVGTWKNWNMRAWVFDVPADGRCPRTLCWKDSIDGVQITEGHRLCATGPSGFCDCYEEHDEAVAECEKSSTCLGIATQSDVCDGKYRLAHGDVGGAPTLNQVDTSSESEMQMRAWVFDQPAGETHWTATGRCDYAIGPYGVATLGSATCPSGYTSLTSKDECETASDALALSFTEIVSHEADGRIPCAYSDTNDYNDNDIALWKFANYGSQICRRIDQ